MEIAVKLENVWLSSLYLVQVGTAGTGDFRDFFVNEATKQPRATKTAKL